MDDLKAIGDAIRVLLKSVSGKSEYFKVYDVKGEEVVIRVGNHSANKRNGNGLKVLSFVSGKTVASNIGRFLDSEFLIVKGSPIEHFKSIEDILEFENVSSDRMKSEDLYYDNL